MPALAYKKILVKLSGEAFGPRGLGIRQGELMRTARELSSVVRLGMRVGVVVGGGNWWRKRDIGKDMDPVTADYIGIVATVMNALALKDALKQVGVRASIQSAVSTDVPGVEKVSKIKARTALARGGVVIFAGGTGKPFFTTDTAAAQAAVRMEADIVLKVGPVDGVYSADPTKVRSAKKYAEVTMAECLRKGLKVMDAQAFALCRRTKIPIVVARWKPGVISAVAQGKMVGTLVKP